MSRKLLFTSTGAAAGFGSIALAQKDTPSEPTDGLDASPDDVTVADGQELFESEDGAVLAERADDGPGLVWRAPAEGCAVDVVEAAPDDDGRRSSRAGAAARATRSAPPAPGQFV